MPRWHPISISGYHIREAGSTAQQELAFTLKDGFTYVERAIERGLDVDDFAPRLSFFFNAHIDFFEEIAKYRAARRIWARELRDTYGATRRESLRMRFHTQTAGVSLTAQQPLVNIVRTTIEALAGGARRHPVAAHQLLRRGARAADRGGGADRAAHAAGDRPRDRRDEHDRPARRRLLRREAHRRDGGAPPTSTSPASTSSAAWSRRSSRASRSARSPTPPSATSSEVDAAQADRRRRQRLPGRRRGRRSRRCGSTRRWSASRRAGSQRDQGRRATQPRSRRRWRELRRAAADDGENLMPHFLDARAGPRLRGRDGRRPAGGLRHLHRAAGLSSLRVFASAAGYHRPHGRSEGRSRARSTAGTSSARTRASPSPTTRPREAPRRPRSARRARTRSARSPTAT